jgi:hypothetical protein
MAAAATTTLLFYYGIIPAAAEAAPHKTLIHTLGLILKIVCDLWHRS